MTIAVGYLSHGETYDFEVPTGGSKLASKLRLEAEPGSVFAEWGFSD